MSWKRMILVDRINQQVLGVPGMTPRKELWLATVLKNNPVVNGLAAFVRLWCGFFFRLFNHFNPPGTPFDYPAFGAQKWFAIRVKRVLFSCCQPHLCTKRHCYFKIINCTWSRSPHLLILSWTLRPQFQAQPYSSESYKVLDIPSTIYSPQPPHTLSTFPSSLPFLMPMSCFANQKCFLFISCVSYR